MYLKKKNLCSFVFFFLTCVLFKLENNTFGKCGHVVFKEAFSILRNLFHIKIKL